MRCRAFYCLGWLFVGVLSPTAHGDPSAQKEFAAILRCKANVAHGQTLFDTCTACHGKDGEGNNAKRYPRLAGQHSEYLLDQLQVGAEGRRPHFPPAHIRLLQSVNRAELVGIADYLSRIGP